MSCVLTPANVDFKLCNGLCIFKGADWVIPVTVCNRENMVDTPCDLSGMTGTCLIKKKAGDDEPVATPTVTITDASEGQFKLTLPASSTINFITRGRTWKDVSEYVYDVYFTVTATGAVYRTLMGIVEVSPSVKDGNDDDVEEEE